MISRQTMIKDDLTSMSFLGVVIDADDPTRNGRCKIRVFGKFDDLEDEDIPWANPQLGLVFSKDGTSGAMSIPRKGAVVSVLFNSGNIYSPEFASIQEPSNELIAEIKNSYPNAHSLIYDDEEEIRVYYTQEKGYTMYLKGSRVNIANDNSITIEHKDTSSIIELRGNNITVTADSEINVTAGSRCKITSPEVWVDGKETKIGHVPAYSAVLAEPLWAYLKVLSAAVDAKLYPTPGAMSGAAETAEQLSTSTTVKVSK